MAGNRSTRLVAPLAALFLATPGHAARPFVTDDARVVDQGHCQLESFYKEQRAYSGSEFWVMPACNPFNLEITVGGNRIEDEKNGIVQAKYLFKELQPNGIGLAASLGYFGSDPYANAIASFSFLDDRAVIHTNLGYVSGLGATWGAGLEALAWAPRVYGIVETFGQRSETPTLHYGLRFWVIPNRFQVDATQGRQSADPEKRFFSLGVRLLF